MPTVVNDELLKNVRQSCFDDVSNDPDMAKNWAATLGPLAGWWLRPEILDAADLKQNAVRDCSQLPSTLGSCCIILAQPTPQAFPLFRDAMLLPLEWRQGFGHSPTLPPQLRKIADRIIGLVGNHEDDGTSWGLHLNSQLNSRAIDLSGLTELTFDSEIYLIACRVTARPRWLQATK